MGETINTVKVTNRPFSIRPSRVVWKSKLVLKLRARARPLGEGQYIRARIQGMKRRGREEVWEEESAKGKGSGGGGG